MSLVNCIASKLVFPPLSGETKRPRGFGFTIVELLIVVVVVAILAAITIVSYNGITKSSTETLMRSDLNTAAKKLRILKVEDGRYPAGISSLGSSPQVRYEYTGPGVSGLSFCLTATVPRYKGVAFSVDQSGEITDVACPGHSSNNPPTPSSCFVFTDDSDDSSKSQIVSYNTAQAGCGVDVVIPSTLGGKPVASISSGDVGVGLGFYRTGIRSVSIPDTVTKLRIHALGGNYLTAVSLPVSVKSISNYALANNSISSINIPSSVTYIGNWAFSNNQLPDDQAFIMARTSTGDIDSTRVVGYGGARRSDVVIPSTVVSIEGGAFGENGITSITIPDTVTTIGNRAFRINSLASVSIPNSVASIGIDAFDRNELTSITVPSSVTSIGEGAFGNNPTSSGSHSIVCRIATGSLLGTAEHGCASRVFY